jgi:hypothetical protein
MMRIFSGTTKVAFGFGLGIAAAGILKEMAPAFRGLGRPLLKATIKSAMIFAHETRAQVDAIRETLSDVKAEVDAELRPEGAPSATDRPSVPKQTAGIM